MEIEPEIVTAQTRLERLCASWREAGLFAFDTEFIRDDTYDAALCLVQVADGAGVTLIDPAGDVDVNPFWELVADDRVVKVLHAGKEDLELCVRFTGRPPRSVFDVQVAAGFVGLGYPLSLSRLVATVLGARLAKAQTLTDWSRRPLTSAQIAYAVDDVAYLPRLHASLCERLDRTGHGAWAAEEFRRYESVEHYKIPSEERVYKLKGSRRLDALGLATLARLIDWRDRWARERNRPTRALIRDDMLVEIARRRPRQAVDLQVLRGFPQARNPKVVQGLLACLEEARQAPREEWPEPFKNVEDTPMTKVALDVLSAFTRAACNEDGIDKELVGATQRLRELMEYLRLGGERPVLLSGWRAEFIGRRLVDLLQGRCELHLSGWPDALRLDVVAHDSQPGDAQ